MGLRSELGQYNGTRCKSVRGILFPNLNGCLVSEERSGNQAQHTAVGLLRLGFHGHGHDSLTTSVAGLGDRLASGRLHGLT